MTTGVGAEDGVREEAESAAPCGRRSARTRARDRALVELGWYVLRVAEQHVIADLDAVVERVSQTALRIAAR